MEDPQDAKSEAAKESSTTSVFMNAEPMREEQVQNAVKFLSHPNVKGSPVIYRLSFLERKGLTKEEIDEAFRRVPDSAPNVSSVQPAVTNQDGQLKSSSNTSNQPAALTQSLQPAANASSLSQFHWFHSLLAVGFLAVSGAGTAVLFKNSIIPRLKAWIRKVVLEEEEEDKPSLAEEAAAAAKAAAAAAADVALASQDILISKTEEKRYFEELTNMLDAQVQEMKSMSSAIKKLEGQRDSPGQEGHRACVTSSKQLHVNGKADSDLNSARSLSPFASVEPSVAPHLKSYMETRATVQRGEKPPNVKPWEVGQAQYSSTHIIQSQEGSDGLNSRFQDNGFTNGDSSVPWWQRQNVRISEIETIDEQKTGSSGVLTNERPVQHSWVPPQPPPVAMAEAAAAIRQPKKASFHREQFADGQIPAPPPDMTDELQRITKISESGGTVEANGGSSGINTNEIQKADNYSYNKT